MKTQHKTLILLFLILAVKNNYGQVPQAIPYQAVARNNSGNLIINQNISLRFSIHDASAGGTVIYQETKSTITNNLGLFSVNIGLGTPVVGTFSSINWGINIKFLQVELDTLGGNNYTDMGTQQMLSVPYALFSAKSADLPSGNASGDVLVWNGSAWIVTPKCNLYNYYFRDKDQDGYGDRFTPVFGCSALPGFVSDSTDCNDNNPAINPSLLWYADVDGDGYGNIAITQLSCLQPSGFVSNSTDCNDNIVTINPTASDLPDDFFIDNNCDGIDGSESASIFVATSGNDINPGTKTQPKLTINAGIVAAISSGKTAVLISSGTYAERVTPLNGISLYGGYNAASSWSRSPSNIITVTGLDQNDRVSALEGSGLTSTVTIDRIRFITANASGVAVDGRGKSNYGVILMSCTGITFKNCVIQSGKGSNGNPGTAGTNGLSGSSGGPGSIGNCEVNVTANGGSGGTSPCGINGGAGGAGRFGSLSGLPGSSGVGASNGGNGGNSGDPGSQGTNGGNGSSGSAGLNGAGGSGGTLLSLWVGSNGVTGNNGNNGTGGGGGGGGGGQTCFFCVDGTGNGGGGGGGAGCLGTGGSSGMAGGGAFGVLLVNSSGIQISNSSITSGGGGNGGSGAIGGTGGLGAAGGLGASVCLTEVGRGGNGGAGGNGGNGGNGGGGSGGPSYSVYRLSSTVVLTATPLIVGFGGTGGSSTGNPGSNGASVTLF
jgi:hypothetical protein